MVGLVRRRVWRLLWGLLAQWNGMGRSVMVRDVEALVQDPGVNQFARRGLFKHRLVVYGRAVCSRKWGEVWENDRCGPYR